MSSGASHGQPSQSAAESVAKTNCSYLASDCQPLLSRSNLCLALATSLADRATGWAAEPNRDLGRRRGARGMPQKQSNPLHGPGLAMRSEDGRYPPPALALPHLPGVNPIVGCFQWINGGEVVVLPNNKAVGGPFIASWQTVNAAQRMYAITWPQPVTSKLTISADKRSLSGTNQYAPRYGHAHFREQRTGREPGNWEKTASKVTVTSNSSSNSACAISPRLCRLTRRGTGLPIPPSCSHPIVHAQRSRTCR